MTLEAAINLHHCLPVTVFRLRKRPLMVKRFVTNISSPSTSENKLYIPDLDAVEGVKICETDANGDEHCRSLPERKLGLLYSSPWHV